MYDHWIILDCHSLCHRLFHAVPSLTHEDIEINVVFGFLRDIRSFQNKFMTRKIVFAWDVGDPLRKQICPSYKLRPVDSDPETMRGRQILRDQIHKLRTEYVPVLGYKNNFWADGYEADDVIAAICKSDFTSFHRRSAVIVSSDHDLYQLLGPNVSIFHPVTKKTVTHRSFQKEWGLHPRKWVDVKAMAGCISDNIKGIEGVGEKTAAKYLRGELKKGIVYDRIIRASGIRNANMELVSLPFKGTPKFDLREDDATEDKWDALASSLDMDSLVRKKGSLA